MKVEKVESKVALVTGGSSGVGLSIVKALVKENYKVFFIGSNQDKGKQVETQLSAGASQEVNFIALDLSDLNAVKRFAGKFKSKNKKLDLLVNAAGVVLPKRELTDDGLEKTFAIGYLATFILTRELEPVLAKADNARIVNVSGGTALAFYLRLNFENLNADLRYNGVLTAAKTVHAKAVLAEILARRYEASNITVNAFHPGIVKSDLGRNMIWPLNSLMNYFSLLLPKDSKTGIHASLSTSLQDVTGKFLVNKKQIPLKFKEAYKNRLLKETDLILDRVIA